MWKFFDKNPESDLFSQVCDQNPESNAFFCKFSIRIFFYPKNVKFTKKIVRKQVRRTEDSFLGEINDTSFISKLSIHDKEAQINLNK